MKSLLRGAAAAYIAIMSYLIINLFTGYNGIASYNELKAYKITLENNIAELEIINSDLQKSSEKLINDTEEIKIRARDLGWYEENEGIILIKNQDRKKDGYTMGRLLSQEARIKGSQTAARLISIMIAAGFYFFLGFLLRERNTGRAV